MSCVCKDTGIVKKAMAEKSISFDSVPAAALARCMNEQRKLSRFNGFYKTDKPLKRMRIFFGRSVTGLKPRC
jgi:hypothetical protein